MVRAIKTNQGAFKIDLDSPKIYDKRVRIKNKFMDLQLIVTIILWSSVVAAIVAKTFDILTEKKRKKEEQYQKLYGPLKFYLTILDVNKSTREELLKANKEKSEILTKAINDAREKFIIFDKFYKDIISPSIIEWWLYVDKIKEILEMQPSYIKKEHWEIVKKFIKNYIFREQVVGKNIYKDTSSVLPPQTIENAFNGLHDAIEEMKKKIL